MISSQEQITKEWLSATIKQLGMDGGVAQLTVTPAHTYGKGKVFHLEVVYERQHTAPNKFFLKLLNNAKAYHFYTKMGNEMEEPPLIPLYDAEYDSEAGQGYLLMANLSESHYQTVWPVPPNLADCRAMVDVLARFHAHWWEHPCLEGDLSGWVLERRWQNRLLETAGRVKEFLAFLGDRLSEERQQIYRQLVSRWPGMVKTRQCERPLTVTHGDAHAWNFLFPHDSEKDKTVLFDWTNWDISTAMDDLAYMVGLHWYPVQRAELEVPLLREYHARLVVYGVKDYPWEECWEDYRRSILRAMLIPAWQWEMGIAPEVWWPHLERGLLAYEDLSCDEFMR